MPLFRPARGRRRRAVKRARTPAGPPVMPHPFVSSGIFDHHGVESCGSCPMPADRTDVHVTRDVDPDAAALSRRIAGDRE
jgi:hypothetical protein